MGVGAGLYMYVVVVQKFTFAISSHYEFLYFYLCINILGTQRADTFFMPKSSDTIRYTAVAWMSGISAVCRIVRRLSSLYMSLTI